MSKVEKQVEKFLNNPSSIKYTELSKLLVHFGFEIIEAKGSHVKFKHSQFVTDLIIPVHNGDCKEFYKKEAQKRVQQIKK